MSRPAARPAPSVPPGRFLFDALVSFLREDGWPIEAEDENEQAIAVPVEGASGRWICVGQIFDRRPLLLFSSLIPAYVPKEARAAVGEFLHRANAGLLFGGFQFAVDDGDIRYVTTLDLSEVDADVAASSGFLRGMVRRLVYANVATTDQYYSALMSVIHAGVEPTAAVAVAEAGDATAHS
jgi:hypothetical protein